VSPPDRLGSPGVSGDIVRAAVDTADLILAEVNPNMPHTLGTPSTTSTASRNSCLWTSPLPELSPQPLDDVCRDIGRNIASLIPDGATLQMGIGKIPDATLAALSDWRDLGIHTEMSPTAVTRAAEWWREERHRRAVGAGPAPPYTVADACRDYLSWFREHRRGIARTEDAINRDIAPELGHFLLSGESERCNAICKNACLLVAGLGKMRFTDERGTLS
jgi:hypothetical protein